MNRAHTIATKETYAATIPIKDMVVDEYQGHVKQALVEKIAAKWDDSAAGVVILNWREDDTYAVLDGQHRVLAAKKAGVRELQALVFVGKSRQEEARLFVQLNTKHNVSAMDRFKANLFSGQTREKNIRAILREVGLDITGSPSIDGRHLQAVVSLTKIYDSFGPTHLRLVAGILTSAFDHYGDRGKGYSGPAWEGVAQFMFRYPQADVARLVEKLREKPPTVIAGMADMQKTPGQELFMGWGKVMTGLYNHGFRTSYKGYLDPMEWTKKKMTPKAKASAAVQAKKLQPKALAASKKKAADTRALKLAAKGSK